MSTDQNQDSNEQPTALDQKARLECEKLRAEIDAIRRPFFQTAGFYTAITPIILAILGLMFSWWSGWFDVQRTRVNNEKLLVQTETERLQKDRANLDVQTREQQSHLSQVESEVRSLRVDKSALTNQITRLERHRDEIRRAKEYFETEAKRLAGSETNALKILADLQAAQSDRNGLSLELRNLKSSNETLRTSITKQLGLLTRSSDLLGEATRMSLDENPHDKRHEAFRENAFHVQLDMWGVFPWAQAASDQATNPLNIGPK